MGRTSFSLPIGNGFPHLPSWQDDGDFYDDIPEHAAPHAAPGVEAASAADHQQPAPAQAADTKMGALKMASRIKGLDTTKVVVDDDQALPAIAAHSEEEGALLREMEGLLVPGSSAQSAGVELKLMCLRGRKYEPARAAEVC